MHFFFSRRNWQLGLVGQILVYTNPNKKRKKRKEIFHVLLTIVRYLCRICWISLVVVLLFLDSSLRVWWLQKIPTKIFKTLFSTLVFPFFLGLNPWTWFFYFFFLSFQVTFLQWTKHNNFWGRVNRFFFFRNMFKFQNLTAAETMSKIQNESIG
jgi:hypothetical protein